MRYQARVQLSNPSTSHFDSSRLAECDFTHVLQEPFKHHQDVALAYLTVSDLLCVFDRSSKLVMTDSIGLPAAKNCVLHAVVFHVLGGYQANLPPPPPTSAEARSPEFASTLVDDRAARCAGVGAEALAPISRADYLLHHQVLWMGKVAEIESKVCAPRPAHALARAAAAPPACRTGSARARRPPPTSRPRLALSALTPPLPCVRRMAPRTCPERRPRHARSWGLRARWGRILKLPRMWLRVVPSASSWVQGVAERPLIYAPSPRSQVRMRLKGRRSNADADATDADPDAVDAVICSVTAASVAVAVAAASSRLSPPSLAVIPPLCAAHSRPPPLPPPNRRPWPPPPPLSPPPPLAPPSTPLQPPPRV